MDDPSDLHGMWVCTAGPRGVGEIVRWQLTSPGKHKRTLINQTCGGYWAVNCSVTWNGTDRHKWDGRSDVAFVMHTPTTYTETVNGTGTFTFKFIEE